MDHWIAASLFLSDGRVIRFGPDEADAENVPSDIAFDTSNPGGFGSASITLPRPEDLRTDDAKLFSHVELYGPGNIVYYEGFINGIPQVGADSSSSTFADGSRRWTSTKRSARYSWTVIWGGGERLPSSAKAST